MRTSTPSTPCTSRSQHHSPRADTIRFGLGLGRTAAVVALVLLAAPAFAVTTNISVAGVPPDQVQSVTLTVLGGATVQAERGDDDQAGGAVWVVDTPEAMPSGTIVDVAVGLVSGQTAVFFTNVRLDGAIAVEAEAFYTESTSQAAVTSDANAAESLTVHTAPGNVVKLIPYFTPPLAGVAPDTAAYTNFFLHEIASRYAGEFSGAGSAADAGLESAENLQGFFDVTDDWNFNLSGYGFRFTDSGFSETGAVSASGESGLSYEQQVADALRAVPSTSGSVAQETAHSGVTTEAVKAIRLAWTGLGTLGDCHSTV